MHFKFWKHKFVEIRLILADFITFVLSVLTFINLCLRKFMKQIYLLFFALHDFGWWLYLGAAGYAA